MSSPEKVHLPEEVSFEFCYDTRGSSRKVSLIPGQEVEVAHITPAFDEEIHEMLPITYGKVVGKNPRGQLVVCTSENWDPKSFVRLSPVDIQYIHIRTGNLTDDPWQTGRVDRRGGRLIT